MPSDIAKVSKSKKKYEKLGGTKSQFFCGNDICFQSQKNNNEGCVIAGSLGPLPSGLLPPMSPASWILASRTLASWSSASRTLASQSSASRTPASLGSRVSRS